MMAKGKQVSSKNVSVAVRIRPLISSEIIKGDKPGLAAEDNKIHIFQRQSFEFDYVYGPDSSQEDVYNGSVLEIIDSVKAGFNCTVLAYGPTGSGKSYTMGFSQNPEDSSDDAIVQRMISDLFDNIISTNSKVTCSMLEIHNEELCDLLTKQDIPLNLRETPSGEIQIRGLSVVDVKSSQAALSSFSRGCQRRSVNSTNVNERSSRSHCIFTLNIEQTIPFSPPENEDLDYGTNKASARLASGQSQVIVNKINIVDLAGAERVKRTGVAVAGARFKESISINSGLLALGNVIAALSAASHSNSIQNSSNNQHVTPSEASLLIQQQLNHNASSNSLPSLNAFGVDTHGNTPRVNLKSSFSARSASTRFNNGLNVNSISSNSNNNSASTQVVNNNSIHIPYRASKLTRLLQDSLGGTASTLLVACVSPSTAAVEESICCLRYASRARKIKNSLQQHAVFAPQQQFASVLALQEEVKMLRNALKQQHNMKTAHPGAFSIKLNKNDMKQHALDLSDDPNIKPSTIALMNRTMDSSKSHSSEDNTSEIRGVGDLSNRVRRWSFGASEPEVELSILNKLTSTLESTKDALAVTLSEASEDTAEGRKLFAEVGDLISAIKMQLMPALTNLSDNNAVVVEGSTSAKTDMDDEASNKRARQNSLPAILDDDPVNNFQFSKNPQNSHQSASEMIPSPPIISITTASQGEIRHPCRDAAKSPDNSPNTKIIDNTTTMASRYSNKITGIQAKSPMPPLESSPIVKMVSLREARDRRKSDINISSSSGNKLLTSDCTLESNGAPSLPQYSLFSPIKKNIFAPQSSSQKDNKNENGKNNLFYPLSPSRLELDEKIKALHSTINNVKTLNQSSPSNVLPYNNNNNNNINHNNNNHFHQYINNNNNNQRLLPAESFVSSVAAPLISIEPNGYSFANGLSVNAGIQQSSSYEYNNSNNNINNTNNSYSFNYSGGSIPNGMGSHDNQKIYPMKLSVVPEEQENIYISSTKNNNSNGGSEGDGNNNITTPLNIHSSQVPHPKGKIMMPPSPKLKNISKDHSNESSMNINRNINIKTNQNGLASAFTIPPGVIFQKSAKSSNTEIDHKINPVPSASPRPHLPANRNKRQEEKNEIYESQIQSKSNELPSSASVESREPKKTAISSPSVLANIKKVSSFIFENPTLPNSCDFLFNSSTSGDSHVYSLPKLNESVQTKPEAAGLSISKKEELLEEVNATAAHTLNTISKLKKQLYHNQQHLFSPPSSTADIEVNNSSTAASNRAPATVSVIRSKAAVSPSSPSKLIKGNHAGRTSSPTKPTPFLSVDAQLDSALSALLGADETLMHARPVSRLRSRPPPPAPNSGNRILSPTGDVKSSVTAKETAIPIMSRLQSANSSDRSRRSNPPPPVALSVLLSKSSSSSVNKWEKEPGNDLVVNDNSKISASSAIPSNSLHLRSFTNGGELLKENGLDKQVVTLSPTPSQQEQAGLSTRSLLKLKLSLMADSIGLLQNNNASFNAGDEDTGAVTKKLNDQLEESKKIDSIEVHKLSTKESSPISVEMNHISFPLRASLEGANDSRRSASLTSTTANLSKREALLHQISNCFSELNKNTPQGEEKQEVKSKEHTSLFEESESQSNNNPFISSKIPDNPLPLSPRSNPPLIDNHTHKNSSFSPLKQNPAPPLASKSIKKNVSSFNSNSRIQLRSSSPSPRRLSPSPPISPNNEHKISPQRRASLPSVPSSPTYNDLSMTSTFVRRNSSLALSPLSSVPFLPNTQSVNASAVAPALPLPSLNQTSRLPPLHNHHALPAIASTASLHPSPPTSTKAFQAEQMKKDIDEHKQQISSVENEKQQLVEMLDNVNACMLQDLSKIANSCDAKMNELKGLENELDVEKKRVSILDVNKSSEVMNGDIKLNLLAQRIRDTKEALNKDKRRLRKRRSELLDAKRLVEDHLTVVDTKLTKLKNRRVGHFGTSLAAINLADSNPDNNNNNNNNSTPNEFAVHSVATVAKKHDVFVSSPTRRHDSITSLVASPSWDRRMSVGALEKHLAYTLSPVRNGGNAASVVVNVD